MDAQNILGAQPEGPASEEAKPIGLYQKPDEEIVRQLKKWFKESSTAQATIRTKRNEEWKFLAGDQWAEADAKLMDKQKRPRLTLNLLLTIMAAVEGEERTNRQEITTYGEGQEDDPASYGLNRLIKWVMNQCDGEFELSSFFRSGAAVGQGWIVPEVDYFEDPEGKILLSFVDDDEAFPDPLDTCPVGSKARFFIRAKMIDEDEMEAKWPGSPERLKAGLSMATGLPDHERDRSGYPDIYLTPGDTTSPKLYDGKSRQWCVLECWWTQIEPGWVVVNEQTGILEEKTEEDFNQMRTQREGEQAAWQQQLVSGTLPQLPDPSRPSLPGLPQATKPIPQPPSLQASQRPIRCVYQAFTCHDELLEKGKSPIKELKRIPYVPFRAFFDKIKKEWFGILRSLLDPQRQHNVEQSALVQLTQLMPKQAWYGPRGSFHNKQEWQEKIAQPGAMLEFDGRRGEPKPVPVPQVPRHMMELALTRPQMMREISGVNTELTGQRVGSDAGVVMEQRRRAAQTVLAPIFDNFRRSKIALGKVLLAYIQTYVKPGRRIRVLGHDENQYVEMSEQMGVLRYDIKVDETNDTINDRIQTFNILQTTLPALMKSGMSITPDFVDLMPMPPHVRKSWKRQISWEMTVAGKLPPADWQPGMPVPMPGQPPQPGQPPMPPPGAQPPPASPQPAEG